MKHIKQEHISVLKDKTIELIDENLGKNGVVYGRIIDEENNPINECYVILYRTTKDKDFIPIKSTITNETGVYLFGNLSKGTYKIKATKNEKITIGDIKNHIKEEKISINKKQESEMHKKDEILKIYDVTLKHNSIVRNYEAKDGILSDGMKLEFNKRYTSCIGGIVNNSVTFRVNVPLEGEYTMLIKYMSIDKARAFKVDINGVKLGEYRGEQTCTIPRNDQVLTIKVNLNKGENSIKFYNDNGFTCGPNIGGICLTKDPYSQVYSLQDKNKKDNSNIILNAEVSKNEEYEFIIKYVANENIKFNIDINDVNIEKEYDFQSTKSLDIEDVKYKQTKLPLKKGNNIIKIYSE
ncbi:hypothetical protein ADU90_01355 [Clostridium botulinum]|uniref:Uncharacterized protein n=1 Tax=Clostridium botulinum C/D str. DC5 TaxID=1443128 RepID=A0A0A0I3M4_CLOBO|nr:SdrD B-like domain-containing protein [Clostridium botulinum]KEI01902.1 hypothetical protein Z952_09755 [Clostridium botulinum C/D str. BKT75002]KEI10004.1 hypothetical protein Z954_10490 [Clostridium botulinum C/D str. BKT2873]KGM96009.1 hypothetical protein Z955_13460 [Clostridium botulinum C/D str. DC5]KGM98241.1 hypothetical protein Z956_00770 [Clostridium botulinum D str. CCUG 7971]KOC50450.1 hypothetical protein ADU88_03050 [Clostridium botulinum]